MPAAQAGIWDAYYRETDPEVRRRLLQSSCEAQPEDGLNALRRALWDLRYTDPGHPGHRVDRLLWQCVNLLCVYKLCGPGFRRKGGAKEVRDAMRTMGFEEARPYGGPGREELYREFRNALRRYFSACRSDRSYRKKYFGIFSMNDRERGEKLARDAWRLSVGIGERFGLRQELEPFSRAVKDQFFASVAEPQALWDGCAAAAHRRKRHGGPSAAGSGES